MLSLPRRLLTGAACPCPSTSTALRACAHSHVAPAADSHPPALAYPAPLWEKRLRHRTWQTWISRSRTPLPLTGLPEPPPPPPSRLPSLSVPSATEHREDPQEMQDLKRYLALRNVSATEYLEDLGPSRTLEMARLARASGMTLVSRLILADLTTLRTASSSSLDEDLIDPRSLLAAVVATNRSALLPTLLLSQTLSQPTALARLTHLWNAFVPTLSDPVLESPDLPLVLRFLYYLSSPSREDPKTPPTPHLSLGLQVVQSLLSLGLPEDLVSSPPVSAPRPNAVVVQLLLLRSVVLIALTLPLPSLAQRALADLRTLRLTHSLDRKEDVDMATELVWTLLDKAAERSKVRFKPIAQGHDHPLVMAFSVLNAHIGPQEVVDNASATQLLDAFAEEAARYERWDLLAKVWERYATPQDGWVLRAHQLKLVTYLLDAAPRRVYERHTIPLPPHSPIIAHLVALRTVRSFAGRPVPWSLHDRQLWLTTLCSAPLATPATRRLARSCYTSFMEAPLAAGQVPFVVSSSLLLTLVRTSASLSTRDFPHRVLRDFILSISVSRGPTFDPFDLTAVAHAYVLLGENESAAQVYAKLVEQKACGDGKDVEVLLAAAMGNALGDGVRLLRRLREVGVVIKKEWLRRAVMLVPPHKANDSHRLRLAAFARHALEPREAEEVLALAFPAPASDPVVLRRKLVKSASNYKRCCVEYAEFIATGATDPPAFQHLLRVLSVRWRTTRNPVIKADLCRYAARFLAHAQGKALVTQKSGFERVFRWLMRVGDKDAVRVWAEESETLGVELEESAVFSQVMAWAAKEE